MPGGLSSGGPYASHQNVTLTDKILGRQLVTQVFDAVDWSRTMLLLRNAGQDDVAGAIAFSLMSTST